MHEPSATLAGVRVCVTGFEPEDREVIKELVLRAGGAYDNEMARFVCTHLLAADGAHATPKYVHAKRWGSVAIVPVEWLKQSLAAQERLPEAAFLLEALPSPKSTAPQPRTASRAARSARPEQAARVASVAEDQPQPQPATWGALHLSGCRILFLGFDDDGQSALLRKLRGIAWRGGATCVLDAAPATHVVVGAPHCSSSFDEAKRIVTPEWLLSYDTRAAPDSAPHLERAAKRARGGGVEGSVEGSKGAMAVLARLTSAARRGVVAGARPVEPGPSMGVTGPATLTAHGLFLETSQVEQSVLQVGYAREQRPL